MAVVLHGRPDMAWPFEEKGVEAKGVCYLVQTLPHAEHVISGQLVGADALVDLEAHAAVENGDLAALEKALSRHPNRRSVDLLNEEGQSLLTAAAEFGHADIVQQLVYKKANVNHKSSDGTVPIVMAAFGGVGSVVHALLRTNRVDALARFGDEGSTALHIAAQNNKVEVSKNIYAMILLNGMIIVAVGVRICMGKRGRGAGGTQ